MVDQTTFVISILYISAICFNIYVMFIYLLSASISLFLILFIVAEMFVENVLTEVKGKATLVAMDRTGSITLQRLLPLSSPQQVGEVLAELGGESGSEFKAVSCDRCGGHVVESAVRQMSRLDGASTLLNMG